MFPYVCLFFTLLFVIIFLSIFITLYEKVRVTDKIKNFESYIAVLEFHMKKAYDIIYRDKILIYSLDGAKINDIEFNDAVKQYVLLVFKFIGENLKNEFIELYGSEDTLIFVLIEYFNHSIDNDEIREKSRDAMIKDF